MNHVRAPHPAVRWRSLGETEPAGVAASVALLPALGTTARIWDEVVDHLRGRLAVRVLVADLPGHGGSDPLTGPITVTALAAAAARALQAWTGGATLDAPLVVAGVSVGGALALEIARAGYLPVSGFAMVDSAVRFGSSAGWTDLEHVVARHGTEGLVADSEQGWFTPGFALSHPHVVAEVAHDLEGVDDHSYLALCRALAYYDGGPGLEQLGVPALLAAGHLDTGTPATHLREVAARLPDARFVDLDGAHLAVLEDPVRLAEAIEDLLGRLPPRPAP